MQCSSHSCKSAAVALAVVCSFFSVNISQGQLSFNFTDLTTGGAPTEVTQGFIDAGNLWSNIFDDDITINVEYEYRGLGSGVLGSTRNERVSDSYADVLNAFTSDASSADDFTAVGNLQTGSSFSMLINRTTDNPNGLNSATPYLDNNGSNNNSTIRLSRSNAKALGLIAGDNANKDGAITFSNSFSWDFDRSNGISSGSFDFVGVAAHEIGHLLGFTSGVDILDGNGSGFSEDSFTWVNTLDLFRFSDNSGLGTQMDWAADDREKYFSIDGGATQLANFSLGRNFGDGQQASHWKDNLNIGLMDPTLSASEFGDITALDLRAFDVIGFDLISAVPEPGSLVTLGLLGTLVCCRRRRRRIA